MAQALHWFNLDAFYDEVLRIGKPGSLLAVWCYNLLEINPQIDAVVRKLYADILGDQYWDPERKLIENKYQTIPFPFKEIHLPPFEIHTSWHLSHLTGYLNSWSAVQHYMRKNGTNPVEVIYDDLKAAWGSTHTYPVSFPLHSRVGRINT